MSSNRPHISAQVGPGRQATMTGTSRPIQQEAIIVPSYYSHSSACNITKVNKWRDKVKTDSRGRNHAKCVVF